MSTPWLLAGAVVLYVAWWLYRQATRPAPSSVSLTIKGHHCSFPVKGNPCLPPYAAFESRGHRPTMEDQHRADLGLPGFPDWSLFSVFDGHAGQQAALFAKNHLHRNITTALANRGVRADDESAGPEVQAAITEAFLQTDRDFLEEAMSKGWRDGSTAVLALVTTTTVVVANVGDSRGVLYVDGHAVEMSQDHKPNRPDEKRRVELAGGFVIMRGCWRVQGVLATSRAIGDKELKAFVIADPDFESVDLRQPIDNFSVAKHHIHTLASVDASRHPNRAFLVLATDGLWDHFSSAAAARFALPHLDSKTMGADLLVKEAIHRGSADNITVVVVDLSHRRKLLAQE